MEEKTKRKQIAMMIIATVLIVILIEIILGLYMRLIVAKNQAKKHVNMQDKIAYVEQEDTDE